MLPLHSLKKYRLSESVQVCMYKCVSYIDLISGFHIIYHSFIWRISENNKMLVNTIIRTFNNLKYYSISLKIAINEMLRILNSIICYDYDFLTLKKKLFWVKNLFRSFSSFLKLYFCLYNHMLYLVIIKNNYHSKMRNDSVQFIA